MFLCEMMNLMMSLKMIILYNALCDIPNLRDYKGTTKAGDGMSTLKAESKTPWMDFSVRSIMVRVDLLPISI